MSYWFAVFAAAFFICYWSVQNAAVRQMLLLFFGAGFQWHFAGPAGVYPIILLTLITYSAGISGSRFLQKAAIVTCVCALVFYKYSLFLAAELLGLISKEYSAELVASLKASIVPASPPLAISFFVFEFVHYLIEVLRGHAPMRSVKEFGVFTLFWPSMVAGPIKRYQQFSIVIREGTAHISQGDIIAGALKITVGLLKKFAADNLTLMLDYYVPQFDTLPLKVRWMIFVGIGFRILLDFSGYSDMAIGFARMMGIRLPENFNWPYLATSISDFWQKWHISLSSWIRDYVYIPLGGGRQGTGRKITNALAAMALCGLWHGAGWNFIFWGIYHGLGVGVNTAFTSRYGARIAILRGWNKIAVDLIAWSLTMLFVLVGWLFFFYPLPQAIHMMAMLVRKA